MKISEIFYSIQGEGINCGEPAVFIRFFGCNLSCTWCDTKYSWHPKHAEWTEIELLEVVEKVQDFCCSHIIFTGGEPALFQKEILQIVEKLPVEYTYEIESNGTIDLSMSEHVYKLINISPKLQNSGVSSKLKAIGDTYMYKFVVQSEVDMPEILALQEKYHLKNILLMPEGKTKKQQLEKSPQVIELCQKYGFRFSPRLQCLLWNDQKGR